MDQPVFDDQRNFYNKWEMHKLLVGKDVGPCQLPETRLFTTKSVRDMLDRFPSLYVKPLDSWGGRSISRIDDHGDRYVWTLDNQSVTFPRDSIGILCHNLTDAYATRACIVQQSAPVVQYGTQPFDIRVHMQRECDEAWVCGGMLARIGGGRSIVSNVAISSGLVLPVEEALTVALPQLASEKLVVKERLAGGGLHICAILDAYHEFEEIGVDLGIDQVGQLWLFEVNTNDAMGGPSHELFARLSDQTMYHEIRQRHEARFNQTMKLIFEQF